MQTVFDGVSNILGVPYRVALIPATNLNRPGQPHQGEPDWAQNRKLTNGKYATSTVHETANLARGANAEMHRNFVWQGGGTEGVSFHAVVDDKEIIQLLPLDEVAWHAGDGAYGTGNSTSIATETCVNADGDWSKTLDNLAKWQAYLLHNAGLAFTDMVEHNHWSGKDCPHIIRSTPGGWQQLGAMANHYLGLLNAPQELHIPGSVYPVTQSEFIHFYLGEPKAALYFGLPIAAQEQEVLGDGKTYAVQYFERARFELHTETNPPQVMLGLVGAELRAYKRRSNN